LFSKRVVASCRALFSSIGLDDVTLTFKNT